MNKKQVIWLIIRLVGIWFCWEALLTTATILSTIAIFGEAQAHGLVVPEAASGMMIQIVLGGLVKLVIGLYCVGGGELLFSLLNREPDNFSLDSFSRE
jgi:hypothetical protein